MSRPGTPRIVLRADDGRRRGVHSQLMTINRFRIAAAVLIGFNVVGTILTWLAHLQKPGTGVANAIGGGTQFTGPLVIVAIASLSLVATASPRRWPMRFGAVLIGLWGAGFTIGEISELFQTNVGISAARWDFVLAASVLGGVIGSTTAVLAVRSMRRPAQGRRPAAVPVTTHSPR